MAEIIWSNGALLDLEEIAEYISKDSPAAAQAYVQTVYQKVAALSFYPQMGRVIPEFGDVKKREIFIHSYRLQYQVNSDDIWIVALVHFARNINH